MAEMHRRRVRARRTEPDLRIGLDDNDLARYENLRLVDVRALKGRVEHVLAPLIDRADHLTFTFVRLGLGLIYLWFGGLKLLPRVSPAEGLVLATLDKIGSLLFGMQLPEATVAVLGFWEVGIGICFLTPRLVRRALAMFAVHIPATLLPMVLVPEAVWSSFPFALTMEGQYMVKNLSLIGGGLFMALALRRPDGHRHHHEPEPLTVGRHEENWHEEEGAAEEWTADEWFEEVPQLHEVDPLHRRNSHFVLSDHHLNNAHTGSPQPDSLHPTDRRGPDTARHVTLSQEIGTWYDHPEPAPPRGRNR